MEKVPVKLLRKRLDDAGVSAHFDDLAAGAEAIEIRVKGVAEGRSDQGPSSLHEACRSLLAGEVVAVQIRFHQDGAWWCDTIMRVREDYRLVRMNQE